MKKYLKDYREYIANLLENSENINFEEVIKYHEKQIEFFQHERLVHLIVMVLFAILFFISVCVVVFANSLAMILISVLLLALNIPYIMHYYFLENQVQELYNDYNELYKKQYGYNYKFKCSAHKKEKK